MCRAGLIGSALTATAVVVAVLVFMGVASAQEEVPRACTDCHEDTTRAWEGGVFQDLLAGSSHSALDCTDCHESISMDELNMASPKPHGGAVPPVACGECHEDEADAYIKHGRLEVGTDADIPTCSSCHGAHHILPSTDRRSSVHPNNLCTTCKACHTDMNLIKDHNVLRDEPIKLYKGSVHGRRPENSSCVAATCANCHSESGPQGQASAHRILSATDPNSTVSRPHLPNTCGVCHRSEWEDYEAGIHGQLAKRGETDAPVCTDCHG